MHITNFIKTKYHLKFLINNSMIQNQHLGISKVSTKKQKKNISMIYC